MELVKKLREMSGAGMLDCKNALEEADGDLEKAFTILREKGIAKAVKKPGRGRGVPAQAGQRLPAPGRRARRGRLRDGLRRQGGGLSQAGEGARAPDRGDEHAEGLTR